MHLKIREERCGWYVIRTWSNEKCEEHLDMEGDDDSQTKNRNIAEKSHHPLCGGAITSAV